MRQSLRLLGLAFTLWIAALPAGAAAKGTSAGDPAAAVRDGQSGSDWVAGAKKPNWNVSEKISPGMSQILSQALIDFSSFGPKGGCPSAAANTAWNALADVANAGPLDAFLDAIKSALNGVKKVATFGADPSAAGDMVNAGSLVDKYIDELKSGGTDAAKAKLKEKIEELWKGKPVEVLERRSSRGGCDTTVIAIWDRAASSYEVTVYGNCHCNLVPLWGGGGTTKLKAFAAQLRGSVTPAMTDDGVLVLNVGFPEITVSSNCGCDKPDRPPVTAPPPGEGGFIPVPPADGGPTAPGGKHDAAFWRTLKTGCPACQSIVDKIHAAQQARDGMDSEFRDAKSSLEAAQSRGDKAEIATAQAAMNALTRREAGLIELQEALLAEMVVCEKQKCPPHAGGTGGNCPPPRKRPRAPVRPGSGGAPALHGRAGSISYDADRRSQQDHEMPASPKSGEPWSEQYQPGAPGSGAGGQAWSSGSGGDQWHGETYGGRGPGSYGEDRPDTGGYPAAPRAGSVPLRDKLVSQIQHLGKGSGDSSGIDADRDGCDPGAP